MNARGHRSAKKTKLLYSIFFEPPIGGFSVLVKNNSKLFSLIYRGVTTLCVSGFGNTNSFHYLYNTNKKQKIMSNPILSAAIQKQKAIVKMLNIQLESTTEAYNDAAWMLSSELGTSTERRLEMLSNEKQRTLRVMRGVEAQLSLQSEILNDLKDQLEAINA